MSPLSYGFAAVVAFLVLALGVMTVKYERQVAGRAEDKAKYGEQVLEAAAKTLVAEQRQREIQKRMDDVLRSVSDDGEKRLAARAAAVVRLTATADGLRDERDALAVRAGEAGGDPAASEQCQAAAKAAGVLTVLHGELEGFARAAARGADNAALAGDLCERAYDAVRDAQTRASGPPDVAPTPPAATAPAL